MREHIVDEYKSFTTSFVEPSDARIASYLAAQLDSERQWPDPWLSLNPSFASGGTISEAVGAGLLHPECASIFRVKDSLADHGERELTLHGHQRDAVEVARTGRSYVLTTGTGSGKSLAYIVPIVDRVLREREADPTAPASVKAIVVYPMNALANSQEGELRKFLTNGYGEGNEPVTYARYTGQEDDQQREQILAHPPDILLTNYVMLELLLTRPTERNKLIRAARGLRFLVLDELHTYRGRQGADVAMLVRRLRDACEASNLQCVGTSATMSSEGSRADQRATVARVASRLFAAGVASESVIGETLVRATGSGEVDRDALAAAVQRAAQGGAAEAGYAALVDDSLARWIETEFGLDDDPDTGDLIRRHPTTVGKAAAKLTEQIGAAEADDEAARAEATTAIRHLLHVGSQTLHPATGRPLFAFRLHQFIAKGDDLYVSLEAEDTRHITTRYQYAVPHEPTKPLIPTVFCRECGHEYLSVAVATVGADVVVKSRRDREEADGDGYLYLSSEHPWPLTTAAALDANKFPDTWLTDDRAGYPAVIPSRRDKVPEAVRVLPDGTLTQGWSTGMPVDADHVTGDGVRATFIPGTFSFCLRCQTSYEQRGSDFARLAAVGAEGRSSAVTVLTTSAVASLKATPGLAPEARKLLTFVDNRQDASLQAGHVNDFVQVSHLRGALARAVAAAGPEGLTTADMPGAVVAQLGMAFNDYSAVPDALSTQRRNIEATLRDVVAYRLLGDLERGWRVTMPNLEQTGKLVIDYADLDELAAMDTRWQGTHAALRTAPASLRREVLRNLLNELRRSLAIDAPAFDEARFESLRGRGQGNLRDPWAMDPDEKMVTVRVAFPRSSGGVTGPRADALFLSGRGSFGRYLRRGDVLGARGRAGAAGNDAAGAKLTPDDSEAIIVDLLRVAEAAGLVTAIDGGVRGTGYRARAEAMLWHAGAGDHGADDPVRRTLARAKGPRVNPYFRSLYSSDATKLTGLYAREHTAQVPSDERRRREDAFRAAALPMLFCSPTMELGVDIASLNAVALRNVPPTPANYAQRSGRAGRSGQQALVLTYCATGNSHDGYYFSRSDQMVAGSVTAPRLDLTNEDLLRSHLQAIWLAETGIALTRSMTGVLAVEEGSTTYALHAHVAEATTDAGAQARAMAHAEAVIADLREELSATSWWSDDWVARTIALAPAAFDRAADRWRELYRTAQADQFEQNRIVLDPTSSAGSRRAANARRSDAENQLKLLLNDTETAASDFYPYRYFASEGFLPGYSFPRLPLAAYIPGRRRLEGDYLQRPRFLAISEFGPGALIYHEGARYQVERVQVPSGDAAEPGSVLTTEMRRCADCGYWHDRPELVSECQFCGSVLPEKMRNLMQLRTVFTRRRERISSDEEERRRAGFEVEISYRFADRGNRPDSRAATAVDASGRPLLEVVYGDAATVRMANLGERRRREGEDGFWLDGIEGRWLSSRKAGRRSKKGAGGTPDADGEGVPADGELTPDGRLRKVHLVIPYVEDTRNVMVARLTAEAAAGVAAEDRLTVETSLRTALERGVEAAFQLEDSELVSQAIPVAADPKRALFMEASEGGAGVLRRLAAEPDALARAAAAALQIAHFAPDGRDLLADAEGDARCEKACYDCLLSYSNQLDHARIDRHAIRDLLLGLAGGHLTGHDSAPDSARLADLKARCDSQFERDFLDYLAAHEHELPVAAQEFVQAATARPDFTFETGNGAPVAVFLDGPHHDPAPRAERDAQCRARLEDAGWWVVAIRYDEDMAARIADYPSVFGTGR